jgi:hypothetical protein
VRQVADDVRNDQEVKGTVKKREGCTLAGAGECRAFGEFLASLDVVGRERPQRASDLAERQIREMPRLQ